MPTLLSQIRSVRMPRLQRSGSGTTSDKPRTARGRRLLLAVVVLCGLAGAACTASKPEAELASDALDRGLAAHAASRVDEAVTDYREVLVHDPQNKFAYYNLGLIDQTSGRPVQAEANYRRVLTIDPDYTPGLFNLAILREAAGAHLEAVDLYRHVAAVDSGNADAHLNLAFALRSAGQETEAQAELTRALELNPKVGAPAGP
jgi:tetratricopeptide (TPR) repeat protein